MSCYVSKHNCTLAASVFSTDSSTTWMDVSRAHTTVPPTSRPLLPPYLCFVSTVFSPHVLPIVPRTPCSTHLPFAYPLLIRTFSPPVQACPKPSSDHLANHMGMSTHIQAQHIIWQALFVYTLVAGRFRHDVAKPPTYSD